MEKYLENKDFKFEDERLNCAIDTICVTYTGKEKIDFLFDKLTDESVQIINSNLYVSDVPIEDDYFLTTYVTNYDHGSYINTHRVIEIEKEGLVYHYVFKLSYFHDKCYTSDVIGSYWMSEMKKDKNGEIHNKVLNRSHVNYQILSREDTGLFTGTGLYIVKNKINFFTSCANIEIDELLGDSRKILKDRKYYQNIDKEITKKYYPTYYSYYTSNIGRLNYKFENDIAHICDTNFDKRNTYDATSHSKREYMSLVGEKLQQGYLDEFLSYSDWCVDNKVEEEKSISYDRWLDKKDIILCTGVEIIDRIPSNNVYNYYNPNKIRYDEDEEEIIVNKRR